MAWFAGRIILGNPMVGTTQYGNEIRFGLPAGFVSYFAFLHLRPIGQQFGNYRGIGPGSIWRSDTWSGREYPESGLWL